MNCKPGDLAIVVGNAGLRISSAHRALLGRIVRAVRRRAASPKYWELETPIRVRVADRDFIFQGIHEKALKPIRPDAGDDETLAWAGRPSVDKNVRALRAFETIREASLRRVGAR